MSRYRQAVTENVLIVALLAGVCITTVLAMPREIQIVVGQRASEWPNESNTGIPAGTSLTTYTGPCTITADDTVIDSKTVNCDVVVQASNLLIKNSQVNGVVYSGEDVNSGYSFTLQDSNLDATPGFSGDATGVGETNFTVLRSEITGGRRLGHCWDTCLVMDSYFHGLDTDETGTAHQSGFRMGRNTTLIHNTFWCDSPEVPPDGGCSADLTGYGDFATVEYNLIQNNRFHWSESGGYCAYGGYSPGNNFPNSNHVRFIDNVFDAGPNNLCGAFGPITFFVNPNELATNEWTNNTWLDGPNAGEQIIPE